MRTHATALTLRRIAMRIVQYEPTHADALTRLYNEVVAGLVPRCCPVTNETLSSELSCTSADPENLIHSEQVLTAVRGREPVAFAHLAIGRKDRGTTKSTGISGSCAVVTVTGMSGTRY
jgi:hypothetical protein